MKKIIMILSLSLILYGCNNKPNDEDIQTIMKENEYIIVDVRTEAEYKESHVVDAINIPYDKLNENSGLDKDKVILVYCKSGTRSEIAFNNLTNLGYEVYDLGAFSEIDLPKE